MTAVIKTITSAMIGPKTLIFNCDRFERAFKARIVNINIRELVVLNMTHQS